MREKPVAPDIDSELTGFSNMANNFSITTWLGLLKQGDSDAAHALWGRYFTGLVRRARERLDQSLRRGAEEEDVALSAFAAFCHAAERGRFPDLGDREGLWRLLLTITDRKAANLANREHRQKNDVDRVVPASVLQEPGEDSPFDLMAGKEASPEYAAQVADECRRLLDALHDPELRQVAIWKMEGYTNQEIADLRGCHERTIMRAIGLIRSCWTGILEA